MWNRSQLARLRRSLSRNPFLDFPNSHQVARVSVCICLVYIYKDGEKRGIIVCDKYGVRRGFPLPRYPISARPPASPSPAPLGTLTYFKTPAVANAPHDFTILIRQEYSLWLHITLFGEKITFSN